MKNLVIVESPSKSKTIEKYLGKEYDVVPSVGHIRDLATRGKDGLGVDVENNFEPTYIISKDKKDTVKDLKSRAEKADNVYLATDPDREGEAISWHLADELGLSLNDKNRVTFNEITKDAVTEAFKNPREIDMDLVHSQEARRILDRIIGFKLSKLIQKKIKSKSAGRVQSIALKLIVDKEKEIEAFIPEEYWTIDAIFEKDKKQFPASLSKIDGKKAELHNEAEAKEVFDACQNAFTVKEIKHTTKSRSPKPAFITSTLQQEASTKLGFASRRTMRIAQGLYEGVDVGNGQEGLITYMRTDSTRLSNQFINGARSKIESDYGKEYLGYYKVKNDDNAQDAHEAIRPTNINYTPESIKDSLTPEQYKLYKMIYLRALASLMANASFESLSVTLNQGKYDFSASGSTMKFDGYLKAYGEYETNKDTILPVLNEGEELTPVELTPNQHFTEPPARYTEARLIKALEEDGIGRPSTYAMIIDTIQQRGYVKLEASTEKSKTKVFKPTDQGKLTSEKLDEYFSSIINVKYTADMEKDLDSIADGNVDEVKILRDFYEKFTPLLENARENMDEVELEKVGEVCPDCGGELLYRPGPFGKFIACSNFPKCKYKRAIQKKEKEPAVPVGKPCPLCGSDLVKRKSRFGTYFHGCSSYPKCGYMETLDGELIERKKKTATKKKATTKKKTTTRKKKDA